MSYHVTSQPEQNNHDECKKKKKSMTNIEQFVWLWLLKVGNFVRPGHMTVIGRWSSWSLLVCKLDFKISKERTAKFGLKAQSHTVFPVQQVGKQQQQQAPSGNNTKLMMQNGVFLHTKEDINRGCLRTPSLITLFNFTTDMTDDFQRGVIDPLHRQVTSIASREWIKVFFPIHIPRWEEVIVQSEHRCHLYGRFGSQITSFKKHSVTGRIAQWLQNWGTLEDLWGKTEESRCSPIFLNVEMLSSIY